MKYFVQKSYFMGYGSDNTTIAEYDDFDDALSYIKNNPPPDEHDGWHIIGSDGHCIVSTQYQGELIHIWRGKEHEVINSNYAKEDWVLHRQQEKERYEQWKKEHPVQTLLERRQMSQQEPLPEIGTRVVHKDDYKGSSGPVWKVDGHNVSISKPIILNAPATEKANAGKPIPATRNVSSKEFREDYVQL